MSGALPPGARTPARRHLASETFPAGAARPDLRDEIRAALDGRRPRAGQPVLGRRHARPAADLVPRRPFARASFSCGVRALLPRPVGRPRTLAQVPGLC